METIKIESEEEQNVILHLIEQCRQKIKEKEEEEEEDSSLTRKEKISLISNIVEENKIDPEIKIKFLAILRPGVKYEIIGKRVRGFMTSLNDFKKEYKQFIEANTKFTPSKYRFTTPLEGVKEINHNCKLPAYYNPKQQTFTFPATFLTQGIINNDVFNYTAIEQYNDHPNLCMIVFEILITLYDFAHDNIKDVRKACVKADKDFLVAMKDLKFYTDVAKRERKTTGNKQTTTGNKQKKTRRKGGAPLSGDSDNIQLNELNELKDTLSFVLFQIIDHTTPELIKHIRSLYSQENSDSNATQDNRILVDNEIYLICFIIVANKIFTIKTSYNTDEYLTYIYDILNLEEYKQLGILNDENTNIKIIKLSIIQTLLDFFQDVVLGFDKNTLNIFNLFDGDLFEEFFSVFVKKYITNYQQLEGEKVQPEPEIVNAFGLSNFPLKENDTRNDSGSGSDIDVKVLNSEQKIGNDSESGSDIDVELSLKGKDEENQGLKIEIPSGNDVPFGHNSSDTLSPRKFLSLRTKSGTSPRNFSGTKNPFIVGGKKTKKNKKSIDCIKPTNNIKSHSINQKGGDIKQIKSILEKFDKETGLSVFLNSGIFRLYTCKLLESLGILAKTTGTSDITTFELTPFGGSILNWKRDNINATNYTDLFFNEKNTQNKPHPVLLILSNLLEQLAAVWMNDPTEADPFSTYGSIEHSFESILFYLTRKIPDFEFSLPDINVISTSDLTHETTDCCPYKFIVSNASTTLNQRGEHFQNFFKFYFNNDEIPYEEDDIVKKYTNSSNSSIIARNDLEITTFAGIMDPAGTSVLKFLNNQEFGNINCFVKGLKNDNTEEDDNVSFNGIINLDLVRNSLIDKSMNHISFIDVECNCEIQYNQIFMNDLEHNSGNTDQVPLDNMVAKRINKEEKITPMTPELPKTRANMFETLVYHLKSDTRPLTKDNFFEIYYEDQPKLNNLLATTLNKTVGDLMQVLTVLVKYGGIQQLLSFGDDVIPYSLNGDAIREINHHDLTASIITYFMLIFGGYIIEHNSSNNFKLNFIVYENPGKNKGGYMSDHIVGRNGIGNRGQVQNVLNEFYVTMKSDNPQDENEGNTDVQAPDNMVVQAPDNLCFEKRIVIQQRAVPILINIEDKEEKEKLKEKLKNEVMNQLIKNFFNDPKFEFEFDGVNNEEALKIIFLKLISEKEEITVFKNETIQYLLTNMEEYEISDKIEENLKNFNALNLVKLIGVLESIVDDITSEEVNEIIGEIKRKREETLGFKKLYKKAYKFLAKTVFPEITLEKLSEGENASKRSILYTIIAILIKKIKDEPDQSDTDYSFSPFSQSSEIRVDDVEVLQDKEVEEYLNRVCSEMPDKFPARYIQQEIYTLILQNNDLYKKIEIFLDSAGDDIYQKLENFCRQKITKNRDDGESKAPSISRAKKFSGESIAKPYVQKSSSNPPNYQNTSAEKQIDCETNEGVLRLLKQIQEESIHWEKTNPGNDIKIHLNDQIHFFKRSFPNCMNQLRRMLIKNFNKDMINELFSNFGGGSRSSTRRRKQKGKRFTKRGKMVKQRNIKITKKSHRKKHKTIKRRRR